MSEPTPPTPRTDAFIMAHLGWCPTDWNWRLFARQLERENAALREALSGRTVSCGQCNTLASENQTLRDAIREAAAAFQFITSNWTTRDLEPGETIRQVFHGEKIDEARDALAKLQPFTTP